MGLKNTKERINLRGGEIHVQSRPAEGTRIFITVPVNVLESPATAVDNSGTQAS